MKSNQSKKKILLTGASGSVGYQVLQQLIGKTTEYAIVVFDKKSRRTEKLFAPYKNRIEIVYGDISDKESVQQIGKKFNAAIHLAALIPPFADEHPDLALKVNTTGTKYLIETLEASSPNVFFLYSSSVSVYGDRLKNPEIRVGDALMASEGDEYAKTKIASEKIIQASSLDWSIFRLTAIMGGHKMSKLMFHMPLKTSMEIATPRDTARAFVNAIDKRTALSKRIFNLGGGEKMRLSYKELLTRSFDIFGLGEVDFPPYTFADINFHCGYYMDGDDLEKIVTFQQDTLESYFDEQRKTVSSLQRIFTSLLKKPIKWIMAKQSEPLNAVRNQSKQEMLRYFGRIIS